MNTTALNALSTTNRIHMGNIPTYIKPDGVKKICQAFGILKYFNMATFISEGKEISKGYCFFEYVNPKQTKRAIKGLDGF